MLVLSRRARQNIVFPGINTTVEVLALKGGAVRLGITAPPNLAVHRGEVLARQPDAPPVPPENDQAAREARHQLNNRLSSSAIAIALLRRQLDRGLHEQAQSTLARLDSELGSLRDAAEALGQQPGAPACSRRALLVEDDLNERELLAGFLRLVGVAVDTAGDGADALDYLRSRPQPDVVLLDMFLPRYDGPSVVRAIRAEPSWAGLRVFGVTGAAHDCFNLPHGPTGIDRWFRKPLNPEALLVELNRELGTDR